MGATVCMNQAYQFGGASLKSFQSLADKTVGTLRHFQTRVYAMSTPWKIFACVLVVAVLAAIVRGRASHSPSAVVPATSVNFPEGTVLEAQGGTPTGPPVDHIPLAQPNTPVAVAASPARTTGFTTPETSGPSPASGSSSRSAPSITPEAPFTHVGTISIDDASSQEQASESDSGQGSSTGETASQRIGHRLRGH